MAVPDISPNQRPAGDLSRAETCGGYGAAVTGRTARWRHRRPCCRDGFAQNQVWCAIVALACEITAWMQMLALHGHPARRWEPKRLRLRLFSAAALLPTSSRAMTLHLGRRARWTGLTLQALQRRQTCTATPAPSG